MRTVELPAIGALARGDGGVVFIAPTNPSREPRQMALIIGERLFPIRQEGR